jgi:hypothetical protein
MFSKKKTECRVCGYRFTPERENIYTAEEPRSMADMLTKAPTRFSAVDCPVCGCQIALAIRAPRIDFPAIVERHDADAEETEGGEFVDEHGKWKKGVEDRYSYEELRHFKICQYMQRWSASRALMKSCPDFTQYDMYKRMIEGDERWLPPALRKRRAKQ